RLWAHGHHPAAQALAHHAGFARTRVLWQMRRSLLAPVPAPRWPAGVTVRTFDVGQDEPAWIACNARAFARHPEQGGWTIQDLLLREAEPWFDPAGFFLAERDGRLAGFHWTKIHGAEARHGPAGHEHPAIGEVYVVGVDPSAQGTGLGAALTLRGLQHLRAEGLTQVLLYVDEDNPRAVALYERLGFTKWDSDITYMSGAVPPMHGR
ncbi:MAG TPA: mycothiol synthase, partial [Mycobacteriales bacterium]|nr:mycothiol synthase [Mycobacteriales bacterium]